MDVVEVLTTISEDFYPTLAWFLKAFSVIAGTMLLIYALSLWWRLEVAQTVDASTFRYTQLLLLFVFASCMLALFWTVTFVSDTFWGYGDYVLQAYENTDEWHVRNSSDSTTALKEFAVMTCRVLGLWFIVWGLFTGARAQYPGGANGSQNPPTTRGAIVRLAVGAALLHPVGWLDLFGNWGTQFLAT